MIRYELPITQHPDHGDSRHVTFYHASEIMSLGWRQLLRDFDVIAELETAVVHVEFSFRHEVFTEPVGVSVVVAHVGNTSIRFGLTMDQGGRHVATGSTTIVKTGGDRTSSIPLDDVQRSTLLKLKNSEAADNPADSPVAAPPGSSAA